ncbi:MAG TPA: DUF6177 family protein [Pseudonocardiaceae bacterium]|nr:DUF6177 family protein [Pseudonocardiaceae bacterium]
MVEPVTWHPTADRATPQALIVEQDRTVVPLSTWVADAAVEATATGRVLQVLTPGHSGLTYPLELLLRDAAGRWVVRERPERFRDGITGFRLRWSGLRFVTDLDAPPPAGHDPQPGSGDLEVQISTLHPAGASVELGASTETAIRALTGRAPAGWGIAEPATQPWSTRELTAQCRERAPAPTQLVVVGAGVIGQLRVERVNTGVLERIRLSGPPAAVVGQDAVEELVAVLAGTARSMIVAAQPGRLEGLRSNHPTPPALPYGILLGHSVVAERGIAHARAAPAAQVSLLGSGTRQACWCRLDGRGRRAPYELLTAVLQHFGLPDPAG